MQLKNNISQLASVLAEQKILENNPSLSKTDLYDNNGLYINTKKFTIQKWFNEYYDYFFNEISKIFKESKVYFLNVDEIEKNKLIPSNKLFDKELFKNEAEKEGNILSLSHFQEALNTMAIDTENNFFIID